MTNDSTTTQGSSGETLSNLSHEERHFDPPEDLAEHANLKADAYEAAQADPLGFWAEQAERVSWAEPFTDVLDWDDPPFAKWFVGGKLNASYNCVDRHVEQGRGDKVAFH
nr:acetyl-coenzyme A synthetase [Nocardioidaceae bacterium]